MRRALHPLRRAAQDETPRWANRKYSHAELLYLAKEYGIVTPWEKQMLTVLSKPFSRKDNDKPFVLDNFFRPVKHEAVAVEKVDTTKISDPENFKVCELQVREGDATIGKDGNVLARAVTLNVPIGMDRSKSHEEILASLTQKMTEAAALPSTKSVELVDPTFDLVKWWTAIERNPLKVRLVSNKTSAIHNAIKKYFRPDAEAKFLHNQQEWLCRAEGVGTRKRATAHAAIVRGTGIFKINGDTDIFARWPLLYNRFDVCQPFKLTGTAGVYDVFVEVRGGGTSGQAGAARLAVARALFAANPHCHDALQEGFCLLEDTRQKMSKQAGKAGARKGFPWTKR